MVCQRNRRFTRRAHEQGGGLGFAGHQGRAGKTLPSARIHHTQLCSAPRQALLSPPAPPTVLTPPSVLGTLWCPACQDSCLKVTRYGAGPSEMWAQVTWQRQGRCRETVSLGRSVEPAPRRNGAPGGRGNPEAAVTQATVALAFQKLIFNWPPVNMRNDLG